MTTTLKDYHYAVETGEALVRAAQVGDLAKVTQLLDEGAGPGYRNFKAVRNANGRRNQPVQCQTGGNPAVPARCARRRPRPGTHGSDAGSGPAPSRHNVPDRLAECGFGAENLGPVSLNVVSVADNVGRGTAPVSANLGRNAR